MKRHRFTPVVSFFLNKLVQPFNFAFLPTELDCLYLPTHTGSVTFNTIDSPTYAGNNISIKQAYLNLIASKPINLARLTEFIVLHSSS